MKNNVQAESLVGVIIGVFILSITLLWLGNLISYSNTSINLYSEVDITYLLKSNISNIIQQTDTSAVWENEIFYIYKDKVADEFVIFTGAINSEYKYINSLGDKVDASTYEWNVYSRLLWVEREDTSILDKNQIFKVSIKRLIK